MSRAIQDRSKPTGGRVVRANVVRLPVVIAVAGLLLVGGLADRGSPAVPRQTGPVIRPMPVAAPEAALSSSWFCAGAVGAPATTATGTLIVANAGAAARHGTVSLIPSEGPVTTVPVDVGGYSRTAVAESAAAPSPYVGAIVDIDGGGTVVEQQVNGPQGMSAAACATTGSDHWYFADGTTQENSSLLLSLLNPYPEDAIVDLSFVTEQGVEAPADFQGIVVPARSLEGIDIGTHLRRRARIATTVSARSGRVVAWKTQIVNPSPSTPSQPAPASPPRVPGVALVLGSPSTGTSWWWPDGAAADGVDERYQIYNPGAAEADVSLSMALDQGSAEPFPLKVQPHDTMTIVTDAQSRVPKGVAHAAILKSVNGVGVVAERTVDAASPVPRSGLLDLLGAQLTARRWVLAAGSTSPSLDEWVILFNPGPVATTVSISALADGAETSIKGLSGLGLPAGRRIAVRINGSAASLDHALLVEAGGDVVVERDLYPVKGLAAAMGVPLLP